MENKFLKPFTITSAGFMAGLIIGKIFQHTQKKKQLELASKELDKLHEIQANEIKKNGKVSEETKQMIDDIVNKTL